MAGSLIGKLILERYQVEDLIDSGGSGSVYRVRDLQRNTRLAMKVLNIDPADDPQAFSRFQREANALRTLVHPNIVPFYGLHQWGDYAFLLQTFIDGPTLKGLQKKWAGQPVPAQETLVVMKALCAALGYAHVKNVVHCDVKPGNVLIDPGGQIYLMDFGIARHANSTQTQYGSTGTPAYMAPEQTRGDPVTAATDIYALGVLLFELATGKRPFTGQTVNDDRLDLAERIRYEQRFATPPDPRSINPSLPVEVIKVILKALAKRAEDRYQTTASFYEAVCQAYQVNMDAVPDRLQAGALPRNAEFITATPGRQLDDRRPVVETMPEEKKPKPDGAPAVRRTKWGRWLTGGLVVAAAVTLLLFTLANRTPVQLPTSQPAVAAVEIVSSPTAPVITLPAATDTPTQPADTPVPAPTQTETILTVVNVNPSDGQEMVYVPAGLFWRGVDDDQIAVLVRNSEGSLSRKSFSDATPMSQVELSAYWIGKYEVTTRLYQVCVQQGSCAKPNTKVSFERPSYYGNPAYEEYPVVNVTWQDAQNYCRWVGGELPSEAQWEKAARGLDKRIYPWGTDTINSRYANINPATDGTTPVGSYPQGVSPYGALDMVGNVYEWVFDRYARGYASTPGKDPVGPATGMRRVVRGGTEYYFTWYSSAVVRHALDAADYGNQVGFRCAWPE